jgi:hypothetical protein
MTHFIAVLAKKKETPVEKGKDSELRKWEAELRKSLATKKPANASNLSKQDRALVDAQLAEEAQIRSKVALVKNRLDRGLQLVRSMVAANNAEFHAMISSIASLLLSGAVGRGALLVGSDAFETYVVSKARSHLHLPNNDLRLNRPLPMLAPTVWGPFGGGSASALSGVLMLMEFPTNSPWNH